MDRINESTLESTLDFNENKNDNKNSRYNIRHIKAKKILIFFALLCRELYREL